MSCKGSGTETGVEGGQLCGGQGPWEDTELRMCQKDHCGQTTSVACRPLLVTGPTPSSPLNYPTLLARGSDPALWTAADTWLQHPGQRPRQRRMNEAASAFRICSGVTHSNSPNACTSHPIQAPVPNVSFFLRLPTTNWYLTPVCPNYCHPPSLPPVPYWRSYIHCIPFCPC